MSTPESSPERKAAPSLPPRIREAVYELHQYLSDRVAPLMVYDSVKVLMRQGPEFLATQVEGWTAAQIHGKGADIPVSDYLYHVAKKLFLLGEFKLVPSDALGTFLKSLWPHLVAICPAEDRQLLSENLERIGRAEGVLTAPVEQLYRQAAEKPPATRTNEKTSSPGDVARALRSFNVLLDRLETSKTPAGAVQGEAPAEKTDVPVPPGVPVPEPLLTSDRKELIPQLVAAAATGSRDRQDFELLLGQLKHLGVDTRIEQLFRALSRSLPDWARPYYPTDEPVSGVPGAMKRIVTLGGDPAESSSRFREMVRAAVEQVNEGSLARAVVMLELADRIATKEALDPMAVTLVRNSAHRELDHDRLRQVLERPEKRLLLKKILQFFPALSPKGILASINGEKKRETRRLLLALLEVHGADARAAALEALETSLYGSLAENEWWFQRNLVYILRHIPRPSAADIEKEILYLDLMTEPRRAAPLVKEALASLGAIKHDKSEQALVGRVRNLTELLRPPSERGAEAKAPPHPKEELVQILDRAVFALARVGTSGAYRAVVDHALAGDSAAGDSVARLAYLAGQDLSSAPDVVERLLRTLRSIVPLRILGMTVQLKNQDMVPFVEALSSTPITQVKQLLGEIAKKDPNGPAGQTAARALVSMDARAPVEPTSISLSGDLEVFGLPMLLQTMEQSSATGTLRLRGEKGETLATLLLESGKLRDCQMGKLTGTEGFYQLLERPSAASFVFSKQAPLPEDPAFPPRDLVPLLLEGMTRYDELKRATALVSDEMVFRTTDIRPTPLPEEPDPSFAHDVWSRASNGVSAWACEAALATDSYRIRRLYAHWVTEGALALQ
jgi:hypothetical protein